ncbi:hypothetical protein PRIPAC_75334 [Pristionchus pacificus]|uniref:Uncharacterized protein n=1 Tax=Pristionchus pacificus TaxID=54126 RepID=A0A2A6C015_PRIPA|nr:hypothetical protein PRIPAC_75334 [Pristionchus pacificus]|eukprot:PDM71524.1 hypothetical protein PRIPAC_37931 [Pristionchus pacificus]
MLPVPVSSLVSPGYECIAIDIFSNSSTSALYKQAPNAPISETPTFINYLSQITSCAHPSIVIGDFNYPTIDWYTNFSLANWDIVNSHIACHDWTIALLNKTATEAYSYFSNFVNGLLDAFVPLKVPKSSSGYPKFLSILHDRLERLHSAAPNCDSTHMLRARFNKALKTFEIKRESDAIHSGNANLFFKYCKSRFKPSSPSLPGIVDGSGAILLTNKDKATAFSKFFSKVQTPPMISVLPLPPPSGTSFDIPYISIEQILRLEHLQLETLEYRRALNDMYFLFDSVNGFVHLDTSNLYSIAPLSRSLRSSHNLRLAIPFLMPVSFSSCASRSLTLWNSLSTPVVTLPRIPYRNLLRRTPLSVLPKSHIKL